jgi:two-component system response regulator
MRPILLVEDNADDVDLTLMALEQEKIANPIEVARDGVEAIARLEDASKPVPMLVLLDLKLPRVSGLEVLKQLRANERTHNVPVVVLTSSREHTDLGSTYDSGANAYVRKPVDFDRFTEIVRQLGLFWLVTNEPPPETIA